MFSLFFSKPKLFGYVSATVNCSSNLFKSSWTKDIVIYLYIKGKKRYYQTTIDNSDVDRLFPEIKVWIETGHIDYKLDHSLYRVDYD